MRIISSTVLGVRRVLREPQVVPLALTYGLQREAELK
jgi:hypothetical protein